MNKTLDLEQKLIETSMPLYTTITQLGRMFGMCKNTARKYLLEMLESDRYRKARVELTLEKPLYNVLAFTDYCQHREALRNKNLAKSLPPYSAAETAETLGIKWEIPRWG